MNTFLQRKEDVVHAWHHIDARDKTLGHLAVKAARLLMGKEKPTYTPGVDCGDFVVVTGAEGVNVSGRKRENKLYRRHTGWVGGLVEESFAEMQAKDPARVVELAIKRMLPKTTLGRKLLRRLNVYAGDEHPHVAQSPQTVAVPPKGTVATGNS